MNIHCHGVPNKMYMTCKFWTENKCRNGSDGCRYLHSYHCPDGEQCRRKYCTLLHNRGDIKKTMVNNKIVIGNSPSKKKNESGSKRRQVTDMLQSNECSIFEMPSNSSDWNCGSVAFEDFDEELCQGLEEVGQELDRFEEELSESSHCEDELVCMNEMGYPSDHSSQDASLSHRHPLKSETFSDGSFKSNRSTRNLVSADTSSRARRLVQGKQTEVFDQPGKTLRSETCLKVQNIPVIKSKCQRGKNKLKEQDPHDIIDLKKKTVPFISVESTTALDSNYLNKDKMTSSEVSYNWPKRKDIKKNGYVNVNNFVNDMNLKQFCTSSVEAEDTKDIGFNIDSLYGLVTKIRGKSEEALKKEKPDVILMSPKSGSRRSCHSNDIISLQTVGSSCVSFHSTQLEGTSGNSAIDVFKDDREEGEICEDDEMNELMSLVSQKQQLVDKVKMLVIQKKNLSLQRDSIMNSFTGNTDKLAKILNENSRLLNEISTQILKLNAQIKLTSRKIDILENNKSFTKTTERKGCDNSKEQENAPGSPVLSQKQLTLNILELFENMSHNKKPLCEKIDECGDKLENSTAKTNCSKLLTEQPASLSNNHSLHDDKIKGDCATKKMHVPERVEKLEVKNVVNLDPKKNVVDEDLSTTDNTTHKENGSIEEDTDSLSHPNSEESKLVKTNEKKSSLLDQCNSSDACNRSLMQTQHPPNLDACNRSLMQTQHPPNLDACNRNLMQTQQPPTLKNNDIQTEPQVQNNVKKLGEGLSKEKEKTCLNKGKMLSSSKDMSTHWCKPCNVFFTHVFGYVKHLESSKHMEKMKDDDTEKWRQKLPRTDTKRQPEGSGGNQETLGVEFLHSTKAFFCELCETVIWNTEEAVNHPQSALHVQKYKEHVLKNTNQEMDFLQAKMAAFTKYCEERIARSKGTAVKEPGEMSETTEISHKTSEDCSSEDKCTNESDSDVICLGDEESKSKKHNEPGQNKRKLKSNEKDRKKPKLASQKVSKSENVSKKGNNQDGQKTAHLTEIKRGHRKKSNSRLSPADVWMKALPSLHLRQMPHSP